MGVTIEPGRLYREHELTAAGWFTEEQLRRGRQEGLRCKQLGRGQRTYLGRWLLDWLEGPQADPFPARTGAR